uniref:Group II intron maturase-specific domain-containing protein n=1 Tax=Sporolithon durum TaxID=48970 RepID=A0A141SCV5_9FLOR|nr:hypothetical protein Sdur_066 [Sporolithon durum]AMK96123.1 hypothetical protein Sdur_066 [Sporolithon durum]
MENNKHSIKYLFNEIRRLIYHKNQIGHWRANSYLTYNRAHQSINKVMMNWYEYHKHLLNIKQLKKINKNIDNILYLWKSKKA